MRMLLAAAALALGAALAIPSSSPEAAGVTGALAPGLSSANASQAEPVHYRGYRRYRRHSHGYYAPRFYYGYGYGYRPYSYRRYYARPYYRSYSYRPYYGHRHTRRYYRHW
jgi:hypothetical protein